jgi:hypothetical protein
MELTQRRARVIRAAATDWRAEHAAGECPTLAALKAARNLDPLADDLDAWGHPFIIKCTPTETRISSLGPDGTAATEDDVAIEPAPAPLSKAPPPPASAYVAPVSGAPTAQSATDAALQKVLRTQIDPRVHDCYMQTLGRDPTAANERAEGVITIAPDGSVKKVSVSAGNLKDNVVKCIADAIEKARFEPSPNGAERTVKYP